MQILKLPDSRKTISALNNETSRQMGAGVELSWGNSEFVFEKLLLLFIGLKPLAWL